MVTVRKMSELMCFLLGALNGEWLDEWQLYVYNSLLERAQVHVRQHALHAKQDFFLGYWPAFACEVESDHSVASGNPGFGDLVFEILVQWIRRTSCICRTKYLPGCQPWR